MTELRKKLESIAKDIMWINPVSDYKAATPEMVFEALVKPKVDEIEELYKKQPKAQKKKACCGHECCCNKHAHFTREELAEEPDGQ